MNTRIIPTALASLSLGFGCIAHSHAQLVILPAPRLLTTMPMGAKAGTTVEVTVTGEHIEEAQLQFSYSKVSAVPKRNAEGLVVQNKFVVSIAPDATPQICEARVMTQRGISSSRAFSIHTLDEVVREKPNTTLQTALPLLANSICNATTTTKAVDYYSIQTTKGHRYAIECATSGIDSKLTPVLIVADPAGRDLLVNRRTGFLDFTAPTDGTYVIKVHGLTFQGGAENFYRLVIQELGASDTVTYHPRTKSVSAASLPGEHHTPSLRLSETEPNNTHAQAQKISIPCTIEGAFATAGDVDTYEFEAKKGEVWWIETVSERRGSPTDPFVLVQHVVKDGTSEKLKDLVELNDISSPVKLSSNGYAYDGPPYDMGSADVLGKMEIKEDGIHRIQIRDLFGATRAEPHHTYALMIRKALPDFALAAWALHMELRNGDRNAVSKPIALRRGVTMAMEVVAVRRDGFEGEITLSMDGLPRGVRASGLRIPAGKNVGTVLITADDDAPRGMALGKILGRANVNGAELVRDCPTASMVWPVKDASQETPTPRLFADTPVSVGGDELTPLSIRPAEDRVWEATEGEKLTIPLNLVWRGDFSGGSIKLKPLGLDFAGIKPFDVPAKTAQTEVVLELATLKTPPGEYAFSVHGGYVAKYPSVPAPQKPAELASIAPSKAASTVKGEAGDTPKATKEATPAATTPAATTPAAATPAAEPPKDIADIVFSEPIRVRIKPAATK
jgi:hypothetical protein